MYGRKDTLSGRERVRLALDHHETDRIPMAMVCAGINPPAYAELDRYLRQERGINAASYLKPLIDIRGVEPPYRGPRLEAGEDIWGVRRRPISYGAGEYDEIEYYPLAQVHSPNELDAFRWPDTRWFDYDSLPDRIKLAQAQGERCLMVSNGNIFETSWYMRGFERILMDFVLNPELVHAILDRVTDFYAAHFANLLASAQGQVDLAFTADDIGGQNGLLMSLEMWEEFIKPRHQRLNQVIHSFGTRVIYHTDGAVMKAVPGLVEMGIDVLQALQFSARGMDPAVLKQGWGEPLSFEGGVSVQTTLPLGSAEDVRREVEMLISVLGKGGGYILGPSHAVQAGTPPENIVAMIDTARDFYPF